MSVLWQHQAYFSSHKYTCGYCNSLVGSNVGFQPSQQQHQNVAIPSWAIYLCPNCGKPTFLDWSAGVKQTPGGSVGHPIENLPTEVNDLYEEARACMSVSAPTSAVLTCRKILMHIAVEKGAKTGQSFIAYVEYLADKNYLPPDGKGWVDHVRQKGNEANHEIAIMPKEEGEQLLTFVEMLLKFVYEFPAKISATSGTTTTTASVAPAKP
jgi:Domain of unknown function (DUF4145)